MTRRRIFKEDAWSSLESHQQGLLIGLGIGAAFWVFTGSLTWIAAGVGLGAGAGRLTGRRRARATTSSRLPAATMNGTPRRRPAPGVLTEGERGSSLHSAAWYNGSRMAQGTTDRDGALEQMRSSIGGFPDERYVAELDAALAGIEEAKIRVVARRADDVEKARQMERLDAVFELHYFNRRFSGHVGEYGLGPIDLVDALDGLWTREEIDDAVVRSDALIEEAIRMGFRPWDIEADMAHLRAAHPGFSDRSLGRALDWGHFFGR